MEYLVIKLGGKGLIFYINRFLLVFIEIKEIYSKRDMRFYFFLEYISMELDL